MSEKKSIEIQLVRKIANGDKKALADLYELHSPVMLSVALKMLKNKGEAEDVIQDVFMEIWKRAGDYDPSKSSVKTWVFLRLRSRCLDRIKSPRVSRASRLTTDAANAIQDQGESAETSVSQRQMRDALSELPELTQRILILGYFQGLSMREIGESLDIPTGTVKSKTSRALQQLKKYFTTLAIKEGPV